jgi:hypothetical protein
LAIGDYGHSVENSSLILSDKIMADRNGEQLNVRAEVLSGTLVDWRELIYQMAIDYLNHHHKEDFYLTIARNNPQYPTGLTGYE